MPDSRDTRLTGDDRESSSGNTELSDVGLSLWDDPSVEGEGIEIEGRDGFFRGSVRAAMRL
jgi:hypothetical protein